MSNAIIKDKSSRFTFNDHIYVIATTVNPRFAVQWVDENVSTNEEYANDKKGIINRIKTNAKEIQL